MQNLTHTTAAGGAGGGPEVDLREILKVKSIARKVLAATAKAQPTEIS